MKSESGVASLRRFHFDFPEYVIYEYKVTGSLLCFAKLILLVEKSVFAWCVR